MKPLAALVFLCSLYIFVHPGIAVAQGSVEADRAALVALYDSTGGDTWKTNTNWKSNSPLAQWHGISIDRNGRIIRIHLNGNKLTGNLPAELGNLTKLQAIDLSNNQLIGEIPVQLENLANIEHFFLENNQLTGSIPVQLGNLTRLERIGLKRNQLTSGIPAELGNLTNLTRLDLSRNQLIGSIPVQLKNLTNLEAIILGGNQLIGEIPVELENFRKLNYLDLGGNQLTGEIPMELGNLTKLEIFSLAENQLTGTMPIQLGNLENLLLLSLSNNQLTDSIPVELGNLRNLKWLNLDENKLTGEIPVALENLTNLEELDLSNNQLTGSIPVVLGNLTNLQRLILSYNRLTGEIPVALENLTNLQILHLANNQLTGSFPTGLCSTENLTFSGNPSLVVDCFGVPDEFAENERRYFEVAQSLSPLIRRNIQFILLQESPYGRLWISDENFYLYHISAELMNELSKYVFSSIPADSTKGILEYSRDILGTLRKNYTQENNGERTLNILCHDYDWYGSGRAFSFYNAISITGLTSTEDVERIARIIGHEYVHNIHFSYAWSSDFFAEGLAEWATKDIIFDHRKMPSHVINNWNLQYRDLPLFPPRPFSYLHANLFVAYMADRVEVENMEHIIQVCQPGGICDADNPDSGDWYDGIDGLDHALSLLNPDLNLMDIALDFHTTNLVNDSSVTLNGTSYGYEPIIYTHPDFKINPDIIVDFANNNSFQNIIKLRPGGVDYIRYMNTSDLHFSIDTNNPQITSLRLFKEKGSTKKLVDIDPHLGEYTVVGDYDRVTLIAVHGNPREDQPDLTLNISATQNYGLATEHEELPTVLALKQNYPNPFNPETVIEYELPQTVHVRLVVYDITGRTVAVLVDGTRPQGRYAERFNAADLSTGTYIYRLIAGGKSRTQIMTLVR